jgi:ABC-type cobalamin/Fe3+-siderophores transport system ATPase subunit
MVCLIGPNGSGKSTLLRTLAGLQKSLSGKALLDGKNLTKLSQQEKAMQIALVLTDRVEVENASVTTLFRLGVIHIVIGGDVLPLKMIYWYTKQLKWYICRIKFTIT